MSSTFSMQSIASPGAKIGELTTGTAVFTKYSRDMLASERSYMVKNNQLAALKKQKARIDESIKKVEHERKSLVSTNCNFILQQQSHACDL